MSRINRSAIATAFGAALREARKGAGMTQEELASRGDFDRTYPSMA
jgi:transcriptional regulator with XRE-family HTH domain